MLTIVVEATEEGEMSNVHSWTYGVDVHHYAEGIISILSKGEDRACNCGGKSAYQKEENLSQRPM